MGCWFRVALACIQGGALNLRLKLFPEWSVGAYAVPGVMSGAWFGRKSYYLSLYIQGPTGYFAYGKRCETVHAGTSFRGMSVMP